jgi:hypothetical protein
MKTSARLFITAAVGMLAAQSAPAATEPASQAALPDLSQMREEFIVPPAAARPWTWFHVMSGNMSREGITKDLESLAQVGVGGIVLFHVTQGIPHGTVRFNSPEHLDLITHVAAECERLGLKFHFHNADGWSSSGGPWISPEFSMKRVVWSDALVSGGAVEMTLPQPPTRAGFFRDIAVIAYPSLEGELIDAGLRVQVSASDRAFDPGRAMDGNPDTLTKLSASTTGPGWVQFTYDEPVAIRSLILENSPSRGLEISLETSEDGQVWHAVRRFVTRRVGKFEWVVDEAFKPITASHFRVVSKSAIEFGELELSALPRIPNLVGHTSLAQITGTQLPETLDVALGAVVDPGSIIDLSDDFDGEGRLKTTLPPGNWTVMRFGYTSTGATNVIASPEGTGLEVDKFSAAAFQAHYDAFIGPVIDRTLGVAPTALSGVMIDSYEVGGQNWTEGYESLFARKFGQSIIPWLPAYAGRLVSSPAATRDMLKAIRGFNSDLIRDNYYGAFADQMAQRGLDSLVEPYGMGPYDVIDAGSTASVPTGEFWIGKLPVSLNDAVAPGRLYGKPVIAAEAFTSQDEVNWRFSPAMGKKWGDFAWVAGVNQFMFHRFAHQANTHVMPGMTMNRYGSHFDRTQTWWDEGGAAWFRYMARGQYLLRQGLPVADVAMYVGDDSPVGCSEKHQQVGNLPAGVEFDCVNAETLLSRARFVDGQMELPNGARYSVLWWPQKQPPDKAAQVRFDEARAAGVPVALANQGEDVKQVFAAAGLAPRLASSGALPLFTHRRVGDTDIFFLLNFGDEAADYHLSFAARGSAPQLWNPVTGKITPQPARLAGDARTQVSLRLLAGESAFLVFDPSHPFAAVVPEARRSTVALAEPWTISFDPLYSTAGTIEVPALFDLSTAEDPEIRYFSGKATYRTAFNWTGDAARVGRRIMLDLGQVEVAASVRLNGVELGTVWTQPFAVEVGGALRPGKNSLEITVANLWVNRLIGDAGLENTSGFTPAERWPKTRMVDWYSANKPPPPGPRRTFSTQDFFTHQDSLVPSGLIGPVILVIQDEAK